MWPAPSRRGNGDDVAGLPLFHPRQHALDREKRRSEVALDRCAPALLADVFERSRRCKATAGVCDNDVDRPQRVFDVSSIALEIGAVRHIADDRRHSHPEAADVRFDRRQRGTIASMDSHVRPFLGKEPRDACADAPRTAGDQRDLAVESLHALPPIIYTHCMIKYSCPSMERNDVCHLVLTAWKSGRWLGAKPGSADRKSTRLNSSHLGISYAVFC